MLRSAMLKMSTADSVDDDVLDLPKGTTAMEMSEQASAMMGAMMKSGRSAARGAGLP